jgi:hypothetical protein
VVPQPAKLSAKNMAETSVATTTAGANDNQASLEEYRLRLSKKIRTETYRSITITAKRLGIKIVFRQTGVPDVTSLFIKAVEDQNWRVS